MIDPDTEQLLDRVARFVSGTGRGGDPALRFDELARRAFAFQHARVAPVRALAEARGVAPEDVRSWRDVPPVPALAYKSLDLFPRGIFEAGEGGGNGEGGEVEIFRSSGTTGGEGARSVHRHPFPGLYRTVIDASFPRFCLPDRNPGRRVPMLSLIPRREEAPDSSLSFMIDHAIAEWGEDPSTYAFGTGGLDTGAAAAWCRRVERDRKPALVLATAFALATWLDALAQEEIAFRLPAGSVLFETGGFKGRSRELSRPALLASIEERLGVPLGRVVREYGMTELTSQLYTDVLIEIRAESGAGGDPDLFVAPPWVRVRVLDPETLEEAPPGRPGLVTIFDLANLSSAVHVMTEDLGSIDGGGLRLLGRAAGTELRGCSLTAEEMAGGG